MRHAARGAEGDLIGDRRTDDPARGLSPKPAPAQAREEAFGWAKTIAGLTKVKVRGLSRVRHQFTFAMAAYNLVRMPRLLAGAVP